MGPPGSGKGTFSSYLESAGYGHISAGDLIREEILSGSALGLKLKEIVDKGEYIDADTLFFLVEGRVRAFCDRKSPVIIDGYGKTKEDWVRLNAFLETLGLKRRVILFEAPEKVCLERVLERLVCTDCGYITAKKLGSMEGAICPKCKKQKLGPRMNDTLKVTLKRLKTYHEDIKPLLLETYKGENVIIYNSDVTYEALAKDFPALLEKSCSLIDYRKAAP
jgi:adenylate kinase